jgi:hypothetical protein
MAAAPDRPAVGLQQTRWLCGEPVPERSDRPPLEIPVGRWRRTEDEVLAELADLTDKFNCPYAAAQTMFGGDGRG